MVFSSLTFLFYFFPVFFILYFAAAKPYKNGIILGGSLIFYGYGVLDNPAYILLIVLAVVVNFRLAREIDKKKSKKRRKLWLILGLCYNFGILFIFKYLDFVTENFNLLLNPAGIELPYANLVLPIGISFYTFQITSYLIDVYRGSVAAESSLLKLGTYLCLFPQLIAGPIVTYTEVKDSLTQRVHSPDGWENGLREFTIGLSLKVLIANHMGGLWNQVGAIGYESISTPLAWLGILAFSFQIYFDFYGYSLMAKGLGEIMGFTFPDNFRDPYLSTSMTEFWRRWHMTLGRWFREYIYIPLGGNRKHTYRNLAIVWLLTGLWHGAGWNYVLWGMFCFLLILLEKVGLKKIWSRFPVLGHLYMCVMIPLSWLIFAVSDMGQLTIYLGRLFPFAATTEYAVFAGDFIKYLDTYKISLAGAAILCTGIPRKLYEKRKGSPVCALVLVMAFWLCVYNMYLGLDDPFLYYQF